MRWIYRLQQHVAITQSECNVIVALAFLFGLGLTARYVQSQPTPLPDSVRTESERLFKQRSEQPVPEMRVQAVPVVPAVTVKEPTPPASRQQAISSEVRLNLNQATASQLQRLPRIGPKLAERILAYREEHGPFRRVQDLVQVRGIGEKTLARLKPLLFVEATK
ncbi:MAG: ComEA family DNA-binding protein [Rhodothermales bacterium]